MDFSEPRLKVLTAAKSSNTKFKEGVVYEPKSQYQCTGAYRCNQNTSKNCSSLTTGRSPTSISCAMKGHVNDIPVNSKINLVARMTIVAAMISEKSPIFGNMAANPCRVDGVRVHTYQWPQFRTPPLMLL
ncbi:hypothetical protein TNCV_3626021 [Trichonephila clavipes]|nr:hypothetical protein TNCV_3626021 [Trichonephila clavipes]